MTFATPWAFLLLLVLPIIIFRYFSRSSLGMRSGNILFPTTMHASGAGISLRKKLIHLPFILRLLALLFLIFALARPLEGMEKIYDINKGVAIEVVIDRSSSMRAEMDFAGKAMNRLEVAKQVFLEFVQGNKGNLTGRPNDLIGLVTFARYADTACPLTLAHDALASFVEPIELVNRKPEDGTAIGDALALAAARLQQAEQTLLKQNLAADTQKSSYEIKSKIIILLTDGEQNAGRRTPREAAELAKKWGIKIYAIGIGSQDSMLNIPTLFGARFMQRGSGVNTQTLTQLAQATSGLFRMAEDGDALRAIYEEIDELEKSEIESIRYVDYKEQFSLFAWAGLLLLALETILRTTWFRRIP
jgi:Ca-activated chloride channel family protein